MRLESLPPTTAQHVENPAYEDGAPTGGDHKGCWLPYGVYDQPIDPGRWVHNLEHGAVVLLYDCDDGCPEESERLIAFGMAIERTIVAPAPGLPSRFAAVAWGHRLLGDCLDLDEVYGFYAEHFNQAPEDVSSGGTSGC